jgi:hypothetical protein
MNAKGILYLLPIKAIKGSESGIFRHFAKHKLINLLWSEVKESLPQGYCLLKGGKLLSGVNIVFRSLKKNVEAFEISKNLVFFAAPKSEWFCKTKSEKAKKFN